MPAASPEVEPVQEVGDPAPSLVPAEVPEIGHELQVLGSGEQVVDRGELPGHRDGRADGLGVAHRVVAADQDRAAVGAAEGAQDVDHRRLAGAVGAEESEDRSLRHRQVDAVEDDVVAEGLPEPADRDRGGLDMDMAQLSVGGKEVCGVGQARRTTMSPKEVRARIRRGSSEPPGASEGVRRFRTFPDDDSRSSQAGTPSAMPVSTLP